MKQANLVVGLGVLIIMFASIAVCAAFFWPGEGASFAYTNVRGQEVQVYGRGLYRYDTLFIGAANHGNDIVTLLLAVPLLAYTTWLYRLGSLRGGLLLLGTLVYFLYLYASYAMGIAFNPIFPVYIALFSASLFAFVLLFAMLARQDVLTPHLTQLPRRGVALFMFASGVVTLVVWLLPLSAALARNALSPLIGNQTTNITDVLDLGIITPTTFIAGVLILRRQTLGYLMAFALLVLEILLTPLIAAQTISQLRAGIIFTTGEIVGPMIGFLVLALTAIWVLVALLRALSDGEHHEQRVAMSQTLQPTLYRR
jgi:hypothetical protein